MKKELIIVQTFDKDGFLTGYKVNGELVRCKDCVYCWKFNDKFYLPKKDSLICINDCDVEVHADDFCSWGERISE